MILHQQRKECGSVYTSSVTLILPNTESSAVERVHTASFEYFLLVQPRKPTRSVYSSHAQLRKYPCMETRAQHSKCALPVNEGIFVIYSHILMVKMAYGITPGNPFSLFWKQ